jgi:hypothetical protein
MEHARSAVVLEAFTVIAVIVVLLYAIFGPSI